MDGKEPSVCGPHAGHGDDLPCSLFATPPSSILTLYGHWETPLLHVDRGSTCEAPSSPQCFRRKTDENIYMCEWSMNTTKSDVMFDFYYNETHLGSFEKNMAKFLEEEFAITLRPAYIWVEARVGNSERCTSTKRFITIGHTVKYDAPRNISMSWLKNNLSLSWIAAEKDPALAEVRFRRHEHPTESWENRQTNTSSGSLKYQVIVANLSQHTAYKVQIRHRSRKAKNPLWSDWSPVVDVPAELEQKPEVTIKTTLLNGTRRVMLTWKPMPHAAAVTAVTYSLTDTQSSHGCPCGKRKHPISTQLHKHTTNVLYSAVNISVIARNAAGYSPPAIIQIPAKRPADLKICDKTLLDEKFQKTCLELYELQDGDLSQENVITLTARNNKERKKIRKTLKDYIRYLYFEHRCDGRKSQIPKTVKMCLFYQKEGVPVSPQGFSASSETHSSVMLSWKAIPTVDQRGFLTHYSLCGMKISSKDEPEVCYNISASLTKHRLENLTPASKYNISLAGVTRAGEGPKAMIPITTLPEKPVNVWWSLSLLFVFFFISTTCTFILKKIKNKIFPPVPTPVIPAFTPHQPESQAMLERKEEVHDLMLLQLHPESKPVPEDAEEMPVSGGECDDGSDEDTDNERDDSRMSGGGSDECLSPSSTDEALRSSREEEMTDLEQVDNEIAMLIYRNGLVFDVKTDLP
ncbi:interleukin-12 receptor subunit beta-2 [Symphorus nematophorus]